MQAVKILFKSIDLSKDEQEEIMQFFIDNHSLDFHYYVIFDEKEHISTYGTNGETGRGIGLKVANSFVQKMEGAINVESTQGEGSKFILELPIGKN